MSDRKKTSSPYAVLENRTLDQWKVTELKEELKKRKLVTRGLKEDLVKRLDEAVRAEIEESNQHHDNGVNDVDQPDVPSEKTTITDDTSAKNESIEEDNVTENLNKDESLQKDNPQENLDKDESLIKDNNESETLDKDESLIKDNNESEKLDKDENMDKDLVSEGFQVVTEVSVETSVTVGEVVMVSENEINKGQVQVSSLQPEDGESKSESQSPKPDIGSQVVEVSQVKSESISIDTTTTTTTTMSITEKNELKDNVIADDVKLELDVKPSLDGGKTEPVVVDEKDDVKIAETIDMTKKNDILDVGSPEKLNLDRSSGDDSMEEDGLESKQIDSNFNPQEIGDVSKKTEAPLVDVMVEDPPVAKNTESTKDESDPALVSTKRKLYDQEAGTNSDIAKRQRRWNTETLKASEHQNTNVSTTPKGMSHTSVKHAFSRSESSLSHEEPKERIVPSSSKPPTTSLRIDRFLRPFTLKAVQELLGKTGTVVSFWMDHIKTHCYVTYSSVEEAVETRNAVYNLQWPANGGRLLIAEFVDPSEVKTRTEPPLPSPPTPQPPPAATQHLPPPPPLLLPPPPQREPALPPPPPLSEKLEPPIMTLDDLFRKTRATPRIYYLPLSDEEVAGKLKAQGKMMKQ